MLILKAPRFICQDLIIEQGAILSKLRGTTFYYYILVEQRLSPDYGLKLADDLIERMDVIFVGNGFIFDYKSCLKMVIVSNLYST